MAAVTICSDFGAPKNKVWHCFHCFPIYFPWNRCGPMWDRMPWSSFSECWVLSQLFHSTFTFIKRLLSSFSLSAIRVVSSAYLRLLIFLPAILIPVCVSSSPAFLMMYSAYKLNKQGDNIQPWRTPFPIWNESVVPCPVLTLASWPAYKFLKRQIRWLYPTLCGSMDCSLPDSSVHGISRARTSEWGAISTSKWFPTQGLNPHLLHWQADSLPLVPPGKPI